MNISDNRDWKSEKYVIQTIFVYISTDVNLNYNYRSIDVFFPL